MPNSEQRRSDVERRTDDAPRSTLHVRRSGSAGRQAAAALLLLAFLAGSPGCAAFRPLDGVPARYLPGDFEGPRRSGKETIDLSLLRQRPPEHYRVDAGDVLGIYIEGILGRRNEVPPVHFPRQGQAPPSLGYPIPVREDGTISLPLIDPIRVTGMTIREVEEAVRRAYTEDQQLLKPGRDRILVSLQRPRTYRVLVLRQEAGDSISNTDGLNLGNIKRGTGRVVSLPAYRNDVLHALAETGGLPGLDAENVVYVIHRRDRALASEKSAPAFPGPGHTAPRKDLRFRPIIPPAPAKDGPIEQTGLVRAQATMPAPPNAWGHSGVPGHATSPRGGQSPGRNPHWNRRSPAPAGGLGAPSGRPQPTFDQARFSASWGPTIEDPRVVKIPIRLAPGERPSFTRKDVVLRDGDIVFIESRDTEIFYTGGLLGGGQYTLPRDYDLDVLGAVSIAQSRGGSGATRAVGGISALNQDVTISASDVVILRQLPNGTQVPIEVDLYEAMRDPDERVIIQPGDYVILQYKPTEAIAAFIDRHLLEGALFGIAASQIGTDGNGN